MEKIRLTQYSHGAGCGCKISPAVLDEILQSSIKRESFKNLLVGYEFKDDAAVFDNGDGTAIISTTDFFMPIVDDAFDFGRVASVNAISDVYAMGAKPLMAIGILAWPIEKLPVHVAAQVLEGARSVCHLAGIPLAGGHSIDAPEPIFGLAVTGKIDIENIKMNRGAKPGDLLYLTKKLGVGILTTAEKKSLLKPQHQTLALDSMLKLNSIGEKFGKCSGVHAMTDVTGFGLAGHLLEMCTASGVTAVVYDQAIPLLDDAVKDYVSQKAVPGGTNRNWKSYGYRIRFENISEDYNIIADPQTSGGLLVAVSKDSQDEFEKICKDFQNEYFLIGELENHLSNEDVFLIIRN